MNAADIARAEKWTVGTLLAKRICTTYYRGRETARYVVYELTAIAGEMVVLKDPRDGTESGWYGLRSTCKVGHVDECARCGERGWMHEVGEDSQWADARPGLPRCHEFTAPDIEALARKLAVDEESENE